LIDVCFDAWSVDHGNKKLAMKITDHKSLILNWPNVVSSCGFLWLCVELFNFTRTHNF